MNINFDFKYDDGGLKKLQRNLENLPKESEVSSAELFPEDFISKYTDFQTFHAMVDASGININDSDQLNGEGFSKFVSAHSKFENWNDMQEKALAEYVARKLGL